MRIYTRKGDGGRTGLYGGRRVSKAHPRVDAYGTVDELNAALGLAAALTADDALRARIRAVQARLFDVGADLATPPDVEVGDRIRRVPAEWVTALEGEIDAMAASLDPLGGFVLPGGAPAAAALHLARTICRRAERCVTAADEAGEAVNPAVAAYLNRLSDWLFTAARLANALEGVPDVPWKGA